MNLPKRALCTLVVLWAAGCDREQPSPATVPSSAPMRVDVELPAIPERLRFRKEPRAQGVGLPAGCRLELPTRLAALPEGEVRFITAPQAAQDLVVAAAGDGERPRAGLFSLDDARRPRAFPWTDLDAPPALARTAGGWLAVLASPERDLQTLTLWREHAPAEFLAEGDRLTAWDARCEGDACALLTTRVSRSAGPGASVFLGRADASASAWKRTDIHPQGTGHSTPLSILEVSAHAAGVALTGGDAVEIWNVKASGSTREARLPVEHAAFEVFLSDVPAIIAAGTSVDEPCRRDGFPLVVQRADGQRFQATIPVPPDGLVVRPLEDGFIVAWIAPLSCRVTDRSVVHALLLDGRGEPTSSAMAVADATGFALSTDGRRVDMWLQRGRTMTWATGHCRPARPSPAPSSAAGTAPAGSAFKSSGK